MVLGVSTDSRTVAPGDCFFAIAGEHFDGHRFVGDALAKGAVCAVVDKDIAGPFEQPILRVRDTVEALGALAGEHRRQCGFYVIAITGSVGKTTTRQIVHHVLSAHYRTTQSPKSFNNQIGVPLTLLAADPQDEIIVTELGSNHPGEIAYLTNIAQPDIALVTNVHPAHLEGFGSLQAIVTEKLSIAQGLLEMGVLVVNADIDALRDAAARMPVSVKTFALHGDADYRARDVVCAALHSRFVIDNVRVHLPLPGPGNVENALAAWAVCGQLGVSAEDFARALAAMPSVSMRLEPLRIGSVTVLSDCYNANPASMRNALQVLVAMRSESGERPGRLVFVCGDMAELGTEAGALHAELGRAIARAGVDLLLAVGEHAGTTVEAAQAAGPGTLDTAVFTDAASVCTRLHTFIGAGDIILVKGSRVAKLEMVVEKIRELFAPAKAPIGIEHVPKRASRQEPVRPAPGSGSAG